MYSHITGLISLLWKKVWKNKIEKVTESDAPTDDCEVENSDNEKSFDSQICNHNIDECIGLWEIWKNRRKIIQRRIDTYSIVDRSIYEHSYTFDASQKLLDETCKQKGVPVPKFLPLVVLKKGLYYDVDLFSSAGVSLHLCRKRINIDVTAKLLIGLCFSLGVSQTKYEDMYEHFSEFLKKEFYRISDNELDKIIADLGTRYSLALDEDFWLFTELLILMSSNYIQCIQSDSFDPCPEIAIIKFVVRKRVEPLGAFDNIIIANNVDRSGALVGKNIQKTSRSKAILRRLHGDVFIKRVLQLPTLLGLSSDWCRVPLNPVRGDLYPVHIRFIAPDGMVIDDCILKQRGSERSAQTEHIDVSYALFHHERAILHRDSIGEVGGLLKVKINPKRALFVIPALGSFILLAALLIIPLHYYVEMQGQGDCFKQHLPDTYAPALFILPSILMAMLFREREHERMSKIFGLHRLLLAVVGILSIVSGALIIFDSKEYFSAASEGVLLKFLHTGVLLSLGGFVLTVFQVMRITAMRTLVSCRTRKFKHSGMLGCRDEDERKYMQTGSCVVKILLCVVIIVIIYCVFFLLQFLRIR